MRPGAQMLLAGVLVLGLTALFGFQGWLWRDDAIYAYLAQQILDGHVPYRDAFDIKTPLGGMLGAGFLAVGRLLGADDLLTLRIGFWLLTALSAMALYQLGRRMTGKAVSGWLAAVALIGFWSFGREAVGGPNPKTLFLLLQITFLYSALQRWWLWAGVAAALSCWTWQPGGAFIAAGVLMAGLLEPRGSRWRAMRGLGLGVLLPCIPLFGYFAINGALAHLIAGSVTFKFDYLLRDPWSLSDALLGPLGTLYRTKTSAYLLAAVGGYALLLGCWRALRAREALSEGDVPLRFWRVVLLSLPFPLLWSVSDFQGAADFWPFLPYLSLGIAAVLSAAVERQSVRQQAALLLSLVFAVGLQQWLTREHSLVDQRASLTPLLQHYGPEVKIGSIGAPEALVLLGKANPNPYFFVIDGIDQHIAARHPGGIEGWLRSYETAGVTAIVSGDTEGPHKPFIDAWLAKYYTPQRYGYFDVHVRNAQPMPEN